MDCDQEGCDAEAVCNIAIWIDGEAMHVLYFCAEHAPDGAEFFEV